MENGCDQKTTTIHYLNLAQMKQLILTSFISLLIYSASAQSRDSISVALDLIGLSFGDAEIDSMRNSVVEEASNYREMRKLSIPNDMSYSLVFTPPLNTQTISNEQNDINWNLKEKVALPKNRSDLAFYTVHQLSSLIKNKKITSVELTQFFLDRLRKYGAGL